MSDITNINSIMDVANISENFDRIKANMIEKALQCTRGEMLHFSEFAHVIEYKLDETLSVDLMWNSFKRNIPIYITDGLIQIFGYKGELKEQKKALMKQINNYKIKILSFTNDEYEKFWGETFPPRSIHEYTKLFPKVDHSNGKGRTKHCLIMPRDLKKLMLVVNTENGDRVREYLLRLEEVFDLYMEYQKAYEYNRAELIQKMNNELVKKVDSLKEDNRIINSKLDLANENIAELIRGVNDANSSVRGTHIALSETAEYSVPRNHIKKKDVETYAIYCVSETENDITYIQCRARPYHLKRRCKELASKYPIFREVISLSLVPNARTLASEFERRLAQDGVKFNQKSQKFILLKDAQFTESDMIRLAREVFEERHDEAEKAVIEFPPVSIEQTNDGKIITDRFTQLVMMKTEELKKIARSLPKSREYGGWSGRNKTELIKWITDRENSKNN